MIRTRYVLAMILAATAFVAYLDRPSLPPCAAEDSDNCYWNAATQGNGHGRSFIVINGEVTYK